MNNPQKDKLFNHFQNYLEKFITLEQDDWDILKNLTYILDLKKKEFLMKPSSQKNIVAFITKGLLRTYFISEKGDEFTTDFCKMDEIAVNYRITTNLKDDYYTQAVIDTQLLAIDYNKIMKSGIGESKWNILQSKIVEYYHPLKLEREKNLLSMDAEEKYNSFVEKYIDIYEVIPQYQIASYLGITPIALSRVKKRIKEKI